MNATTFSTHPFLLGAVLCAAVALAACGDDENDPVADTGTDVADAGGDAGDTGADADPDTSTDTGSDTGTDAVADTATDSGADSGPDTSTDTGGGPGTIPEVAVAAGNFTVLVDAVVAAGLAETLSGEGPFTVFAPTDEAFAALPEGLLDSLTIEELTDILLYHVVGAELYATDVVGDEDGLLETLVGANLTVTVDGEAVFVDDAQITVTDIEASNGVIHVIDAVLVPADEPGTIPEVATAAGTFSTLLGAVVSAGLAETLSGEGPFTVFAPTDAAFAALPEGLLESLTVEQLTDVLLYHVVAGELLAADVLAASLLPSLLGPFIKVDAEAVTVAGAAISVTNIEASNGVIHVLDAVMLPPGDIPTVATEAGIFSTLTGALAAADLVGALMAEGPFTVFAPTDDAFAALPEGTLGSLTTEQLTDILLYHVASGSYPASAVTDGLELTMLNGDVATFAVGAGVSIEGAAVVSPDVPASNGLIHVIDAVILPPAD